MYIQRENKARGAARVADQVDQHICASPLDYTESNMVRTYCVYMTEACRMERVLAELVMMSLLFKFTVQKISPSVWYPSA